MPDFRQRARTAVVAGAVLALGFASASAKGASEKDDVATWGNSPTAQHGGSAFHLPSARENIELVSKLELKGKFGDVLPEQIADVAVYKNYAYLNSWSGNATTVAQGNCERGGTYIVDITDPAKPVEVGFVAAPTGSYHGEGAHVITLDSGPLKGHDILGVNNEPCKGGPGGFDLIDVTDPRNPKVLTSAFGDTGPDNGEMTGEETPNSNHSIFMWNWAGRAYAVTVDNAEAYDIDIFDITDPAAPEPVREYDLFADFDPEGENIFPEPTTDNLVLHHDSVVKIINGTPILLTSYWDAGYQTFDASDPANLVHIGDTSFAGADPLLGVEPQEGNAHYGEFSFDNKYILTADEDFSAYRPGGFEITSGQNQGEYPASGPSGSTGVVVLPDRKLNGPVVYGGFGCPAGGGGEAGAPAMPIPQRSSPQYSDAALGLDPGEEAILVLSRGPSNHPDYPETDDNPPGPYAPGGCFPGEKVGHAQAAGWDAVVLVNRHFQDPQTGEPIDGATCGSGAYAPSTTIPSICTTHRAFHLMFNDEPNHDPDYTPNSEPEVGQIGEHVESEAIFDGWGYARLFENEPGVMTEVGAYAVEESLDPRFAFGFGDLSIHEWATDPTEYLAYGAYYSAGVRVASFGPNGIQEVGRFIDQGGSNIWGIEQFTAANGERLMAASDRDYGLYILKYTGPGAAKPPACEDKAAAVEAGKTVSIPLTCTDPNGNPLTLSIATQPANGTLSAIANGAVVYTPKAGFTGDDTFTYRAFDGAAFSAPATVRIRVVAAQVPGGGGPGPVIGQCGPVILGTIAGEILNGTATRDTILGGAGNDTIGGLQGDDCLFGEAGDDRILAGAGKDQVDGGSGKDRLFGDSGNDDMRGREGNDHLRGSSGNDRVLGESGNDYVSGGSNNDTLSGGSGRDSIQGEAGNDVIRGGSGNDSINTGKGRNRVSAGSGNDRVVAVNGSRDRITCGAGRDVVRADRADRVGRSCERVLRTRTTRR